MNTRFVIIESGGGMDSADITYLNIPKDLNLSEAEKDYRKWYAEDYLLALRADLTLPYQQRHPPRYLSFAQWIKEWRGGSDAAVEVYYNE